MDISLYASRPFFITGNPSWVEYNPLFSSLNYQIKDAATFDEFILDEWTGLAVMHLFIPLYSFQLIMKYFRLERSI